MGETVVTENAQKGRKSARKETDDARKKNITATTFVTRRGERTPTSITIGDVSGWGN